MDDSFEDMLHAQEKFEANELHLQELSRRVNALELERDRLQRALKSMTNTEQVQCLQLFCQSGRYCLAYASCQHSFKQNDSTCGYNLCVVDPTHATDMAQSAVLEPLLQPQRTKAQVQCNATGVLCVTSAPV